MAYINKINVDGVEYEVQDENALPAADLPDAINTALAQAKESGAFDGPAGEQGPQGPAGESGVYVGTEAPTDPNVKVWINPDGVATFPMPTADDAGKVLKAKGANAAEWGEASGGGSNWELLAEVELTEDVNEVSITADNAGNPLPHFNELMVHFDGVGSESNSGSVAVFIVLNGNYDASDYYMAIDSIKTTPTGTTNSGALYFNKGILVASQGNGISLNNSSMVGRVLRNGSGLRDVPILNLNTISNIMFKGQSNNVFGIGTKFNLYVR